MNTPIFQQIFADSWDKLPLVFKKHYANRPFCDDITQVKGRLNVTCRGPIHIARPFYRLLGMAPLVNEKNINVSVDYVSHPSNNCFYFRRNFHFKNRKHYQFFSRMMPLGGNKVVEIMRFGFSWRMHYQWNGERVTLSHQGYALKLFNYLIPLPISWILGKIQAYEYAIDETHFAMSMTITQPFFGKIYSYEGTFEVLNNDC